MNPPDGWVFLLSDEMQRLLSAPNYGKKSFSPHIIPKTKGREESLIMTVNMHNMCILVMTISYMCKHTGGES